MKKVMLFLAVAAFAVSVNAQDAKTTTTTKPAAKSDKMATKPATKTADKPATKTTTAKPADAKVAPATK